MRQGPTFNRRWAVVAGLGVIEVWIFGLILRSLSGGHAAAVPAPPIPPPLPFASPAAGAGRTQSIETSASPVVVIDDDGATLTVSVAPADRVVVREHRSSIGWSRDAGTPLRIEKTADGVRIAGDGGGMMLMIGADARRLDVTVPPGARLDVRNAGSVTIAGLRAAVRVHSEDGSVSIGDHRGDVQVSTDDGRIVLTDVDAAHVDAASANGRIVFDRVRAGQVALRSDDGRIDVERSLLRGGKIETSDGRVTLGLDPRSDVTVSAQTSSGKIVAESPLRVTGGAGDDGPSTIKIGDGSGRLDVASSDGSISIRAGEVQPS